MTLRLSHSPNSRSARVRWLLEEIGADYELVPVDREARSSPEHRRRHPLGRVPALETDEGTLFETAALCLYLAELHPEAQLLPPEASFARALVYQWISFGLSELEPFTAEASRLNEIDPQRAEQARERVRLAVAALEAVLATSPFLVGEHLTVADVTCGSALFSARRQGLTDGRAAVEAYLDRLQQRPARLRAYEPS